MPSWPAPSISMGFTYVTDTEPADAVEGETWYDTTIKEGKVYTGSQWVLMTATDHSELSGVGSSNHHPRPMTGQNLTEDAQGRFNVSGGPDSGLDADTVDGKHASDIGPTYLTDKGSNGSSGFTKTYNTSGVLVSLYLHVNYDASMGASTSATVHYQDGSTDSVSASVNNSGSKSRTYHAWDFDGFNSGKTMSKLVVTPGGGNYTSGSWGVLISKSASTA